MTDRETAWLIEWPANDERPVRWYRADGGNTGLGRLVTADANEALRFARKVDAEAVIRSRGFDAAAVEHMWCNPQPPTPQDDPQSRVLTGEMAFPTKSDAGGAVKAAWISDYVDAMIDGEDRVNITNFDPLWDGSDTVRALAPIIAERDAALEDADTWRAVVGTYTWHKAELQAKLAAAEAALDKYAGHINGCRRRVFPEHDHPCDCGYSTTRAALATEKNDG